MKKHQRNLLIILLVSSLVFLFNLDLLPVNIMEARNFVTAREMVEDGNWVLTTMNGEPRYEKPPLPTWLTAFSGMIGGIQNLTFLRLPAAICSLFLIVYFYFLNFRLTENKPFSLMATLIASTSYLIVFMGRQGTWDIFCHTFVIISIYYLITALQTGKEKGWYNWILSGIFLGLSVLSKGPVSLYALFLPFLISYGITYRYQVKEKIPQLVVFLIAALVVGGTWYGYIYLADAQTAGEISSKETTAWANRNVKPFHRYFSFFVQSGVWALAALLALLYPYLKKKVFNTQVYSLFFWWTILSVVLLSVIPEKKERYLLPVMIPLASTTGFLLFYVVKEKLNLKKWEHSITKTIYGIIVFIALVFPVAVFLLIKADVSFKSILLSLLTFMVGIFILLKLKNKEYDQTFFGVVGFMTIIAFLGMPYIINFFPKNKNYVAIEDFKEEIKKQDLDLYTYKYYSPEFLFEYGKKVKRFDVEKQPKLQQFLLITSLEDSLYVDLDSLYTIKSLKSFDHNVFGKESNNHTHRLAYTLYELKKK